MKFPLCLVDATDAIVGVFWFEMPFALNGVEHNAHAWEMYSDDDWAALCPGVRRVPLVEAIPAVLGKRIERRPMAAWIVGADAVTVTYDLIDLTPAEIAAQEAAAGAALQRAVTDAVQRHLDAAAQARNYDSMATCVTYADEPAVPRFAAEGQAARAWRSAVWARCYEVLAEVLAGERAPLTPTEMIAELPPLVWPD